MGVVKKLNTELRSAEALQLREIFGNRIVNQSDATDAYTDVLEKYLSGFYDHKKPIASLLFLGPTGTGKTSSAEAFVEGITGDEKKLIKIDCGEFQHSHDISKIVGSPPGYLGHRETQPLITNAKLLASHGEKTAFAVLLFDEIEKASDALWNLLLGILDKGALTLGTNESVDLTKTIILMSSNIGSQESAAAVGDNTLGFALPPLEITNKAELEKITIAAARKKFTPEFLNRLDRMVMFNTLTLTDVENILDLELKKLNKRATIIITLSPAARAEIIRQGYNRRDNARFLQRTIDQKIIIPIARGITTKQIDTLDSVIVDFKNNQFEYQVEYNFR
jgi:ATP-dependent Clp protease ATP-binding subunit ClpB